MRGVGAPLGTPHTEKSTAARSAAKILEPNSTDHPTHGKPKKVHLLISPLGLDLLIKLVSQNSQWNGPKPVGKKRRKHWDPGLVKTTDQSPKQTWGVP